MATDSPYPVSVDGELDDDLSRWLWLVKLLLAIPHFIVLFFLWVVFLILTVIAFFAILFTGQYPKGIFAFNVGVMRWTWRVSFYTIGALATGTRLSAFRPETTRRTSKWSTPTSSHGASS